MAAGVMIRQEYGNLGYLQCTPSSLVDATWMQTMLAAFWLRCGHQHCNRHHKAYVRTDELCAGFITIAIGSKLRVAVKYYKKADDVNALSEWVCIGEPTSFV